MPQPIFLKKFFDLFPCIFVSFMLVGAVSTEVSAQERTIIVLDGSGSMWGQIDGKPKLQIARETLRQVLPGVPETTALGLMAYGHREKGNCGDIELIVPPAVGTADQIASEVDRLKFLGKTPLSTAVQIAAEEMRYTEDKATVVLITDGIETCGVNVCEIGSQLESQGVNFTAHVVGFGLSEEEGAQVACLAENTGGQYFSANDGESLVEALNETVAIIPPQFTFIARDQDDNDLSNVALDWQINDADGKKAYQVTDKTTITSTLEPGKYTVLVSGTEVSGGSEFTIADDATDQTIYVPVEVVTLTATLDGPDTVAAGAPFEVTWTGPNDKSDYVTIVEVGTPEGKFQSYAYTKGGSPATLTAPDGVGAYELRYYHNPSMRTLATRPISLTAVSATLEAPEEVAAGSPFEVVWTGPNNKGDYVTIVEVGTPEGKFDSYAYARNGSPAKITAPDSVGAFEVRYVVGQSKRTLASRPITLTSVTATVEGPTEVAAGSSFEVNWTGPNNKGDFITIVEEGTPEGKFESYAYARNGSPAKIIASDGLGAYEIRYVVGQSKRTLASQKITLTAVSATLEVLNTPVPGGKIVVAWKGPNNKGDYITIVEAGTPEGKFTKYAYTRQGSPATFEVPRALGNFEIRYVIGTSKRTLASLPVKLEPAKSSITLGTPSTTPGGVVEVTWTGPGNQNDFLEIVPAGADAKAKPLSEARSAQGSPLSLFAPGSAGDYIVRYRMRDNGEVLATAPLTVE